MGDELQTPLSHWSCLLVPFCHQDKCQVALWDYSSRHLGQGLFPELQIRAPTWASYRRAIHSSLVTHYPLPRSLPTWGARVGGPGGGGSPWLSKLSAKGTQAGGADTVIPGPQASRGTPFIKKSLFNQDPEAGLGCTGR